MRLWDWLRQKWHSFANRSQPTEAIAPEADPCNCQPLEVPDAKFLARALFYSFHVNKKGKLKWQAFKPDRGETDISVMRTDCLSANECKQRAKQMVTPEKHYRGFALLHTGDIRQSGFDVRDSRQVFCGHADLLLGVRKLEAADDEPPDDPSISMEQENAGRKLIELSHARIDSSPAAEGWPEADSWYPA